MVAMPLRSRSRVFSRLELPALAPCEKRLLGALLRLEAPAPRDRPETSRLSIVLKAIEQHRLLGVFEHVVRRDAGTLNWLGASGALPILEALWGRNAESQRNARAEVEALEATLRGQGIDVYLLKGAYVGPTCYPSVEMRPMADVDVLVPREVIVDAAKVLLSAGYVPVPDQERNGPSSCLHLQQLMHPARGVIVEVHYQIARGLGVAELAPPRRDGVAHAVLPPYAHFLHRLLDIAKDGCVRVGLLPYLDLLRMRATFGDVIDEDRVFRLAERAGLLDLVANTLWHFAKVCEGVGRSLPIRNAPRCSSLLLRAVRMAHVRADALYRIRYVPRWQRRVVRFFVGSVG